MQLKALLIGNGIHGLDAYFHSNELVSYTSIDTTQGLPSLAGLDLLVVPNGADHVYLYRHRARIHQFLAGGGALFCFDGWFTPWIPGNRWVMDNSRKTIDMRYLPGEAGAELLPPDLLQDLSFVHGMSGWWACGYIEPAPGADILIKDPWDRALMVRDTVSTNGLLMLTASGPLADTSYDSASTEPAYAAIQALYTLALKEVHKHKMHTA